MTENFWAARARAVEKVRMLECIVRDEERGFHTLSIISVGIVIGLGLSFLMVGSLFASAFDVILGASMIFMGSAVGYAHHVSSRSITRSLRRAIEDFWRDDACMVAQMMELEEIKDRLDGPDL